MVFRRYIALGDSISIDLYPARDLQPRLGRLAGGLGAASLLGKNDDRLWPEFRGRDLRTMYPELAFRNEHAFSSPSRHPTDNHTADGATTGDVLRTQLPRVDATDEPVLVTLTIGGNDLLQNIGSRRDDVVASITTAIDGILDELHRRLPNAVIVLGTIYDPSDGTNVLHGEKLDREAKWLAAVNDHIRSKDGARGVVIADIHRHFLGHGLTAPVPEQWYWSGLIIEPNARGASEVRRLFLEATGLRT